MNTLLTKLVAVALAGVISLPAVSWCSLYGDPPPGQKCQEACCAEQPQQAPRPQAPRGPQADCCCHAAAAIVVKNEQSDQKLITPARLTTRTSEVRLVAEHPAAGSPFGGRSHQVLHCVWRL